jgi:hypothetical protein
MHRGTNDKSEVPPRPAKRAASLARWSAAPVLPGPEQCLSQARAGIAQVQQLLADPTAGAMLRLEIYLREVADRLRQFPMSLARAASSGNIDRPALLAVASAAKDELAHATALFQRVGHFYTCWIRLFSALRCGYTRTGAPAKLTCSNPTAVRG